MDIALFKVLLEVLASVGVEEVALDPTEDGTLIRGANKDTNVIVYHTIPDTIVEKSMGIQRVSAVLSRLHLFETDKAKVELEESDDAIIGITIKQGRKKASYKCADASSLTVPKKVPGDLSIKEAIVFDKAYVDHISHAITAMSFTGSKNERSVNIGVKTNSLELTIYDGEDDSFVDEFDVTFRDCKKVSWDVAPFQRVLKQSLECSGTEAKFTITEHGIAVFDLSLINVLVAPTSR